MMGNGVHFQGTLQAFMDNFVLGSMKRDPKDNQTLVQVQAAQSYLDNGEPRAKRTAVADREKDEKPEAKQNPSAGKPGSQFEPLDLSVSVRPESGSGSLPGSSVTIHDNVAWHGCLFCSFSTASLELMALHLQANHLGQAQTQRADTGREVHGEASPATHQSPNIKSLLSDKDGDGERNQVGWSNHIDQPYNPFQSDFYRRFGGLYDGSPRGAAQGLQGYMAATEQGLEVPGKAFRGASSAPDEQVGERSSCGEPEEEQVGSDDEVVKSGAHVTRDTPSATPKAGQRHSDEERDEAEEDEERDDDMDQEEEGSPAEDHAQNHHKRLQDGSVASSSAVTPPLFQQNQRQVMSLEKPWQQGMNLLPPPEAPPALLKAEQQMNMMSVLRAYGGDNLPAFNVKRPDATVPAWMLEEEQPVSLEPALTLDQDHLNSDLDELGDLRHDEQD
ncbi:zinc finger protein 536-like [Hippocampus comes]|uniref:zinc finger protein 536-like n=1 Tax=Hippocampus comes TaxID=109280 RepID=UPI00094E6FDF|nr:PREDICTED: zinc finger protein 536-like [Hippocampus comes]